MSWLSRWQQAWLRRPRVPGQSPWHQTLTHPAPESSTTAPPHWLRCEDMLMGTTVTLELWSPQLRHARHCADLVLAEMRRIQQCMSPYLEDSELSRINREAATQAVPLSEEMFELLSQAVQWSQRTAGAFDITVASIGQHYDYRRNLMPTVSTRHQAHQAVGWQHLVLDAAARTIRFDRPGMRLDLGGFAKGHAVNLATALLRRQGIAHAMVAAGGDSQLLGDRRGRPWLVAVRDPHRPGQAVAVLPLQDVALSTSGDYERGFIGPDGRRHHHVLDPRNGDCARGVRSVTILSPDGLISEALSKAVFVLGPEAGLALAAAQPGVAALVVDAQGTIHHTPDLPLNETPPA